MRLIVAALGALLVAAVLWEAFETLILPRRVTRRLRFSRIFLRALWKAWRTIGRRHPGTRRENYLSLYAPLSLLLLFAAWVIGVIVGFALVSWGLDTPLAPGMGSAFASHLYLSATTFVTLGLGDVRPASSIGRTVTAIEAGTGFAFLALMISYLPVLYQAFSRREVAISMLDAWAGSPPAAVELLRRAASNGAIGSVDVVLADWEMRSAELLESHLSYGILAFFRSQHERQSWLAALTAVLDVSALVLAGVEGVSEWQARRTFAMARHAVVDLAQALAAPPEGERAAAGRHPDPDEIHRALDGAGVRMKPHAAARFVSFQRMYEPYVLGLAWRLEMSLPSILPMQRGELDDWQRTAWDLPE